MSWGIRKVGPEGVLGRKEPYEVREQFRVWHEVHGVGVIGESDFCHWENSQGGWAGVGCRSLAPRHTMMMEWGHLGESDQVSGAKCPPGVFLASAIILFSLMGQPRE